jgi:pimeloyl-ACP methyl ester carboxylesterase
VSVGKLEEVAPPSIIPPGEEHSAAIADDGTRLFVHSKAVGFAEDAVRLFLCDGILCDGFIWKYLWNDLSSLVPLTHWHYRGHGRSHLPNDEERIDIAAHADDLMSVRRLVGDPPAVLAGHSMGVQVALEAYRRHPDKVRGLVLICGSFGKITSTFKNLPVLDLVLPRLLDLALKRPSAVRALWSRIPPEMALKVALKAGDLDPEHIRPEDVMPYLQHMTHVDFPLFLKMLRAAGDHTAGDFLSQIKVPTLVVAGERDTFTPPFLAESMANAIPDAEFLMVKSGTHVASLEQHELVDEKIRDFLRTRVLTS